ncbi:molecular chaperone DnaJ [Actinoplanes sp. NPDC023714]|uniref:molecular chaperone DnaJ n=1 Tax=Actinoplanes sp. NPDC023714 TaxID=3154322 RepID=UPI0033D24789
MSTLVGAERLHRMTFEDAVARITRARTAQDLQERTYREWAKIVHPDAAGARRRATATEAFAKLSALYQKTTTYQPKPVFASGDIAEIFADGAALLKVPRNPADNDLMEAEAEALTALQTRADPRFKNYAPRLINSYLHEDQEKRRRRVNVLERQRGMLRLDQAGRLTLEDAVWIWRRLLIGLGWAHRAGVIHGAVLESHILIHPERRGLVLLDWCYAGHRPRAIVKASEAAYPPEVLHDRTASPATDIYMATGLMTRVIGPSRMPEPLRRFAAGCGYAAPRMRPQDAWELLGEFDELIPENYRN